MDLQSGFERAIALHRAGHLSEAVEMYRAILAENPRLAEVQAGIAAALMQMGQYEQGLRHSANALRLDPSAPYVWIDRGQALHLLARYAEAAESYDRALGCDASIALAYCNRALARYHLQDLPAALGDADRALSLDPGMHNAHLNRYLILFALGRYGEALAHADRAIALGMNTFDPHFYRGNALQAMHQLDLAKQAYERALQLDPRSVETLVALGTLAVGGVDAQKYKSAIDYFDRALSISPDISHAHGLRLLCKATLCDWRSYEQDVRDVLRQIDEDRLASIVFATIAIPTNPAQQLRLARFTHARMPSVPRKQAKLQSKDRIRIGYFSCDFYNHATSHLIAGLIEEHDRSRFEIVGFSFGERRSDQMRQRLEKTFDTLIDVGDKSDEAIAALSREMGVDIAVDLKGLTLNHRFKIFAHGAAPVQVGYLGYPATTGAPFIDYLIADHVLITPQTRAAYTEKVAYLPDSYQANDNKRAIAPRQFTRSELGLPEQGFVFCAFNASYKITPDAFDVWMRLLRQVDGSVLWVIESVEGVGEALRAEAASRGVAPERIVVAHFMNGDEHLARHARGDLFLDTFYCSGHTTAADALWAGLPVVTRIGETFANRVAASLLTAVGLPELIARDEKEYEAIALDLARDSDKLAEVKTRLAANRRTYPLFNTARFTRHIERAFETMHFRAQAGQEPEDFSVEPIS